MPSPSKKPAAQARSRRSKSIGRSVVPDADAEPIVEVHWRDAWFDAEETKRTEFKDEAPCSTVGYLVRETKDVVSIATERFGDVRDTYRGVTHLPRAMVKEIRYL